MDQEVSNEFANLFPKLFGVTIYYYKTPKKKVNIVIFFAKLTRTTK